MGKCGVDFWPGKMTGFFYSLILDGGSVKSLTFFLARCLFVLQCFFESRNVRYIVYPIIIIQSF